MVVCARGEDGVGEPVAFYLFRVTVSGASTVGNPSVVPKLFI